MNIKIKDHNVNKVINDIPYVEFDTDSDTIDFCLGKTLKEGGEICRQILLFQKKKKRECENF